MLFVHDWCPAHAAQHSTSLLSHRVIKLAFKMQFVSTAEKSQCLILLQFLQANKTNVCFCFCCHDEPDNCTISGMGQEPENSDFMQKFVQYMCVMSQSETSSCMKFNINLELSGQFRTWYIWYLQPGIYFEPILLFKYDKERVSHFVK